MAIDLKTAEERALKALAEHPDGARMVTIAHAISDDKHPAVAAATLALANLCERNLVEKLQGGDVLSYRLLPARTIRQTLM